MNIINFTKAVKETETFLVRNQGKNVSAESIIATCHCTESKSWPCPMLSTEIESCSNMWRQTLKITSNCNLLLIE